MVDEDSDGTRTQPRGPYSVLVVGAGLIGSSVGLALRARGATVHFLDRDPTALRLAVELGAGVAGAPDTDPELVVVAVPPASTGKVILGLQRKYLQSIFSDVGSAKSHLQRELERSDADMTRFVGGHPMAGRERSGAGAARADLFEGRPWVLTPTAASSGRARSLLEGFVLACGATPVVMDAERHDLAVALVSHTPQLVASLTAARLAGADDDLLALAGQGVRDLTRIADSDPALWVEILTANAVPVLAVLDGLAADLDGVRADLRGLVAESAGIPTESAGRLAYTEASRGSDLSTSRGTGSPVSGPLPAVRRVLERGNEGRRHLPGKHGAAPVVFAAVPVVVADRPGELARLLVASGDAGVNVEDVTIEHSPGQPVGLVELSVRPEQAARLAAALTDAGWSVHG